MDKKAVILEVAKDLYLARVDKDIKPKSFADFVKMVEEAYNSLKD